MGSRDEGLAPEEMAKDYVHVYAETRSSEAPMLRDLEDIIAATRTQERRRARAEARREAKKLLATFDSASQAKLIRAYPTLFAEQPPPKEQEHE